MKLFEAAQILGLDERDISNIYSVQTRYKTLIKIYHPDIPGTGNSSHFQLIQAAFVLLKANHLGIDHQELLNSDSLDSDIAQATLLKAEVEAYLDQLKENYLSQRNKLEENLISEAKSVIYRSRSTRDLKKRYETTIKDLLIDTQARLKIHLELIQSAVKKDQRDFLYKFFKSLYQDRRRYWMLNLYRNPIVIGEVLGIILIYSIKELPFFYDKFPRVAEILSIWWIPLGVFAAGLVLILGQLILLNPKRQFIPPRLSVEGIKEFVDGEMTKISGTSSAKERSWWGGGLGLGLGALLDPTGATALLFVTSLAGALLGWVTGRSLSKIQTEYAEKFETEIRRSFRQLDDGFFTWLDRLNDNLQFSLIESYKKNSQTSFKYLYKKKPKLLSGANKVRPTLPSRR